MEDKKPDCKIVARAETNREYVLYENGELWTTGEHAYRCGYVSDPENITAAIDAHEEEVRILLAEAHAEFGL